jgi:Ca2+-binding EF-hand superfamily protein
LVFCHLFLEKFLIRFVFVGHIDIAEFCDFIIEGMSLDIDDRVLYSEQSSLHQKLMAIIINVERRLVAMTLNGEKLEIEDNQILEQQQETTTANTIVNQEEQEQKQKQEQEMPFKATTQHHDAALRAMFRNYDYYNTKALNEESLKQLMIDFSNGDTTLYPEDNELKVFIDAMDSDGDGSIDENELVDFFQRGYKLSKSKRTKFSERSNMHLKMMNIIAITEKIVNKRITAVHNLFTKYDTNNIGSLKSNEIGNMIRATVSKDITMDELDLFVDALDNDNDGTIDFNELSKFFLKGLALSDEKKLKFKNRSNFHEKLVLFMEYIKERE